MKRILLAVALAAATAPALATGIDLYGIINLLNGTPQPQVIYRQPILIQQDPYEAERQPIYLHVPPGYAKHWRQHCQEYDACDQPVYFVQDRWYRNVYVPHRRSHDEQDQQGEHHGEHGNGHDKHGN